MQTAPRLPARVVLSYLAAVQEGDGRWPQNMWLDGTAYWGGVQLDECAFPILLIHLLLREKILEPSDADRFTEWSLPLPRSSCATVRRRDRTVGRKTAVTLHLRLA
jgi:glucoamylase